MTEQKIQRTLQIKDGLQYWEYTTVWQMLGDNAALYGDNGGAGRALAGGLGDRQGHGRRR